MGSAGILEQTAELWIHKQFKRKIWGFLNSLQRGILLSEVSSPEFFTSKCLQEELKKLFEHSIKITERPSGHLLKLIVLLPYPDFSPREEKHKPQDSKGWEKHPPRFHCQQGLGCKSQQIPPSLLRSLKERAPKTRSGSSGSFICPGITNRWENPVPFP